MAFLRAKAAEYGVDLIVLNANNNDNDQIEQVKYLLKQEIDVLMIVPTDYKAAAEAVSCQGERSSCYFL